MKLTASKRDHVVRSLRIHYSKGYSSNEPVEFWRGRNTADATVAQLIAAGLVERDHDNELYWLTQAGVDMASKQLAAEIDRLAKETR